MEAIRAKHVQLLHGLKDLMPQARRKDGDRAPTTTPSGRRQLALQRYLGQGLGHLDCVEARRHRLMRGAIRRAIRCNQMHSNAIRCNQMQSDAGAVIRSSPRSSAVIGGHQRPSAAITLSAISTAGMT